MNDNSLPQIDLKRSKPCSGGLNLWSTLEEINFLRKIKSITVNGRTSDLSEKDLLLRYKHALRNRHRWDHNINVQEIRKYLRMRLKQLEGKQ